MTRETENPAALAGAHRANSNQASGPFEQGNDSQNAVGLQGRRAPASGCFVKLEIKPDGRTLLLNGRVAWAVKKLIEAGERGCTPIETPGPRWSDYVFKARREGLVVETIHESHGGRFPGNHARYVLRSSVEILEDADGRG